MLYSGDDYYDDDITSGYPSHDEDELAAIEDALEEIGINTHKLTIAELYELADYEGLL